MMHDRIHGSPITMNRRYVTRDGRAARVLCVDAKGNYPVAALFEINPGDWVCGQYSSDGRYCCLPGRHDRSIFDLVGAEA